MFGGDTTRGHRLPRSPDSAATCASVVYCGERTPPAGGCARSSLPSHPRTGSEAGARSTPANPCAHLEVCELGRNLCGQAGVEARIVALPGAPSRPGTALLTPVPWGVPTAPAVEFASSFAPVAVVGTVGGPTSGGLQLLGPGSQEPPRLSGDPVVLDSPCHPERALALHEWVPADGGSSYGDPWRTARSFREAPGPSWRAVSCLRHRGDLPNPVADH